MKSITHKIIKTMFRLVKAGAWVVCCILAIGVMVLPCLLVVHENKNGNVDIWNAVGLVWLAGVTWFAISKTNNRSK